MSVAALVRGSGFALALAGLLLAVAILFHPSDADPHAVVRPAWVPVHTVLTLATLLLLLGMMGLYFGRLRQTSGWLDLVGFLPLFTGTALFAPTGPLFGGPLSAALLLTGSLFALGCLLWCVSTARGVLAPRWVGLPLLGGILLAIWPPAAMGRPHCGRGVRPWPDLVGVSPGGAAREFGPLGWLVQLAAERPSGKVIGAVSPR